MNDSYGMELIMDIHNCNVVKFNRIDLTIYVEELCELIDMEREDLCFWDYEDSESYEKAPSHLKGTSLVQFIKTSNITIHTLDDLGKVFINIFTCKDFSTEKAMAFSERFFRGSIFSYHVLRRN